MPGPRRSARFRALGHARHKQRRLDVKWPYLWGAAGVLLILTFVSGTFVRRFRWSRMSLYGKQVEVGMGVGGIVVNLIVTVLVLGLTAGLGLPWVYARYRRSFFRD